MSVYSVFKFKKCWKFRDGRNVIGNDPLPDSRFKLQILANIEEISQSIRKNHQLNVYVVAEFKVSAHKAFDEIFMNNVINDCAK